MSTGFYTIPGTYVQEYETALSPDTLQTDSSALAAFVGKTSKGSLKPTFIANWSQFEALYGGLESRATYALSWAVYTYFSNGGRGCYIQRAVKSTAVVARRVLNDIAVTPLGTITVFANSPGTWGNTVYIDVVTYPGRAKWDLAVYDGAADGAHEVEHFADLTMSPDSPRYFLTVINALSQYIVVTDQFSVTGPPNNMPAPQVDTSLATGTNGTEPTTGDYTDAFAKLGAIQPPLVVNIPGLTDADILNDVLEFIAIDGNMFLVIDSVAGITATAHASAILSIEATNAGYAAVYWPRIIVPDYLSGIPGSTATIPAGGAILGVYMRTDSSRGVQKAPAGIDAVLLGVLGLEQTPTSADLTTLYTNLVPTNPLRLTPGVGITIQGARTMRRGFVDQYIPARRTLIYVRNRLLELSADAIFEPNDPVLWKQLRHRFTHFLNNFWQAGGLKGNKATHAFFVNCSRETNPPESVQAGEVHAEVGIAPQNPAEFVIIKLGQMSRGGEAFETLQ